MSPKYYKKSLIRIIFLVIGGALITFLCLVIAGFSNGGIVAIVCWFGAIFFGFSTLAWLWMFLKSRDAIVLTNDGFHDYSSAIGLGDRLISREQVSAIELGKNWNEIAIILENPDLFYRSINSGGKKSITKLNRTVGYGDLTLTTQTISKAGGVIRQRIIEDMLTYRENRMKQLGYLTAGAI